MVASAQQRPPSPPPLPPHHHDDEHAVEGYDEGADATTSAAVKAATTAAGSSNAIHAPATSSASSQHDANAELIASWDPEQLAKIVEAARATATGSQGEATGAYDASSQNLYEQARHVLGHLPGNLSQTASALSEFAAGFKRSDSNGGAASGTGDEAGQAGERSGEHGDERGSREADGVDDDALMHEPGHEHGDDDNHGEGSSRSHHNAATAAAIAAMGTLAGHHLDHPGEPIDAESLAEQLPSSNSSNRKSKHQLANKGGPETERQRKDNHKEVERKRRAGINAAITELQQLVPDCEGKGVNKGDIIYKAAQYIRDLKTNEANNIEKWTLEKLLTDQAMNDLHAQIEASRREVERLREKLGRDADDVPRAEQEQQEQQMAQWGDASHHHHHHHQHHQHQDVIDPAFEQQAHQQQGGSVDMSTGDSSALNDVAAAAAAAARAVSGVGHEGQDASDAAVAAVAAATMEENIEAVRAAAAAATTGAEGEEEEAAAHDGAGGGEGEGEEHAVIERRPSEGGGAASGEIEGEEAASSQHHPEMEAEAPSSDSGAREYHGRRRGGSKRSSDAAAEASRETNKRQRA